MYRLTITSSVALDDEKRKHIIKALEEKYQSRCRVFFLVDEAILGGLIITDGDFVYDGSVLGKLNKIKRVIRK